MILNEYQKKFCASRVGGSAALDPPYKICAALLFVIPAQAGIHSVFAK
jgi:hypothetical protein